MNTYHKSIFHEADVNVAKIFCSHDGASVLRMYIRAMRQSKGRRKSTILKRHRAMVGNPEPAT
jgi:hypothetical protein